jgi:hypothetical protein
MHNHAEIKDAADCNTMSTTLMFLSFPQLLATQRL